jgi:uncharacterized membrane protein YagU involved in acid resistance
MNHARHENGALLGMGILAGLAGTAVLMALRHFDEQYAPTTIPPTNQDPGQYMVQHAEDAMGVSLPERAKQSAVLLTHAGYGSTFAAAYALWRGRHHSQRSALVDGSFLGAAVYAAGHLGWLPALGLETPAWRQTYPQVAAELFRHIAYGVATAATFGAIDALV